MSRDLWHIVWAGQPVTCCYEPSRSPTNTFCRDPAPFLANQQHQPPLPWVKGVQKLYKSFNFRIFNDKGQSRQKTLMQNWHDHLVQFKNFMTFCLTSTASCNKVHFCQLHSSPLRHHTLEHPLFKKSLCRAPVSWVSLRINASQLCYSQCNTILYHATLANTIISMWWTPFFLVLWNLLYMDYLCIPTNSSWSKN